MLDSYKVSVQKKKYKDGESNYGKLFKILICEVENQIDKKEQLSRV